MMHDIYCGTCCSSASSERTAAITQESMAQWGEDGSGLVNSLSKYRHPRHCEVSRSFGMRVDNAIAQAYAQPLAEYAADLEGATRLYANQLKAAKAFTTADLPPGPDLCTFSLMSLPSSAGVVAHVFDFRSQTRALFKLWGCTDTPDIEGLVDTGAGWKTWTSRGSSSQDGKHHSRHIHDTHACLQATLSLVSDPGRVEFGWLDQLPAASSSTLADTFIVLNRHINPR